MMDAKKHLSLNLCIMKGSKVKRHSSLRAPLQKVAGNQKAKLTRQLQPPSRSH